MPAFEEREAASGKRRVFGSTLKVDPAKKLKSRTLEEKFGDDPLRYGPVWKCVRILPCAGRKYVPLHECGPGFAPATAHHLGKDDLAGLWPVCGALHDQLAERPREVSKALRKAGGPTIGAIGKRYVAGALERLQADGRLPYPLEQAARRRGYAAGLTL